MTVQEPDGGYRPLTDLVLQDLRRIDSWRVGMNEQLKQLETVFAAEQMERDRRVRERFAGFGEKARWALKKDLAGFNLTHIGKADLLAEERRIEAKEAQLAVLP
jgi:hypothetical protein